MKAKSYLYKFGKKIFDKIKDVMQPEFPDVTTNSSNPFDFWEGANFKLKIRQVEGYRNYDKSEFATLQAVADDDEKLEVIWNKQHALGALVSPDQFKSYEELKNKLDMVLGRQTAPTAESISATTNDAEDDQFMEKVKSVQAAPAVSAPESTDSDEDDTLSYFKSLAEDN